MGVGFRFSNELVSINARTRTGQRVDRRRPKVYLLDLIRSPFRFGLHYEVHGVSFIRSSFLTYIFFPDLHSDVLP
jgi:hypothetical protein